MMLVLAFPYRPIHGTDLFSKLGLSKDDLRFSIAGRNQFSIQDGRMPFWDGQTRLRDLVALEVTQRLASHYPGFSEVFRKIDYGHRSEPDIDRYFPAINALGGTLQTLEVFDACIERQKR